MINKEIPFSRSNNQRLFQQSGMQILSPQSKQLQHVSSQPTLPPIHRINQNQAQEFEFHRNLATIFEDSPKKKIQPLTLSHFNNDIEQLTVANPEILNVIKHIISYKSPIQDHNTSQDSSGEKYLNHPIGLTVQVHSIQGNFYTPNPVRIATFIVCEDDLRDINQKPIKLNGRVSSALPIQELIMKNTNSNKQNLSTESIVRKSFQSGISFEHFLTLKSEEMIQILMDINNSRNPQQKLKAILLIMEQLQFPKKQQSHNQNDNVIMRNQKTQFNKNNCFKDHQILAYGSYDLLDDSKNLRFARGKQIACYDSNHQPLQNIKQQYRSNNTFLHVCFESPLTKTVGKTTVSLKLKKEEHEDQGEYILRNLNLGLSQGVIDESIQDISSTRQRINHQHSQANNMIGNQHRQNPIMHPYKHRNSSLDKASTNHQYMHQDRNISTSEYKNLYAEKLKQIMKYEHKLRQIKLMPIQNQQIQTQ